MVIAISNISPEHGSRYYQEEEQEDLASDYDGSQWQGQLMPDLNLRPGTVDERALDNLLQGKDPEGRLLINKMRLSSSTTNDSPRGGVGIITNAPKSVSLQSLLFEDQRLIAAHRLATEAMLRLLEERYAMTRIRKDGHRIKISTEKLVIAQFHHVTSRSVDPHLHSHNLILNMTRRPDNRWCSLSNSAIYDHKMLLGKLYLNELAQAVQAMGYTIEPIRGKQGMWELSGVSSEQLQQFSKRSLQIEAAVGADADGRTKARAAMFCGRAHKQPTAIAELRASWQQQARTVGLEPITPEPESTPTVPSDLYAAVFGHALKQQILEATVQEALEQSLRKSGQLKREDVESAVLTLAVGEYSFTAITAAVGQLNVLDQIQSHNLAGGYTPNAKHVFSITGDHRTKPAEFPLSTEQARTQTAAATPWHDRVLSPSSPRSDSFNAPAPTVWTTPASASQFPDAHDPASNSASAGGAGNAATNSSTGSAGRGIAASLEAVTTQPERDCSEIRCGQPDRSPGHTNHQDADVGGHSGARFNQQDSNRISGTEASTEAADEIEASQQWPERELERELER